MAALPLFHSFANIEEIQSVAFRNHNAMALVPNPRDLDDLLGTIAKTRLDRLQRRAHPVQRPAAPPKGARRQGRLQLHQGLLLGAAPLLAETKRRFEELTGGANRRGLLAHRGHAGLRREPGGGPEQDRPGRHAPARRRDPSSTRTAPSCPPARSEALIRAPQLMAGYWDDPEETAITVSTHDGERWLHTGDLGYLDEDGYLFIVDRMKDLIKTHGYQVWPREIEEVLATHPAVAEVGVAGVPDEAKGEVAKAQVVLAAGEQAGVEELRAFCRERLAPYKVPATVEFVYPRRWSARCRGAPSRPSLGQRLDPCHQLAGVERLDHEVVGAGLAGDLLVGGDEVGGEQDHRDGGPALVGSEPRAHRVAVDPRHQHVEQDHVGLEVEGLGERLLAVAGGHHLEALEAEIDLDEADDVGVVVGHQHGPGQRTFRRACRHGRSSRRE